jgi:tetratricopeptide (TPR) repeat protein
MLLLWRLTGQLFASAFVALVFAVHPVHVESVAWVAERKDVLSALFSLLGMHAYVSWVRGTRPLVYAAVVGFFALACMSKPMAVTFPVLLLLLDYWPLRRTEPFVSRFVEKLPLVAIAVATALLTLLAQHGAEAVSTIASVPIDARIANALVSYCKYLGVVVWPSRLAIFYPYPAHVVWTAAVTAGGVLSAATLFALSQRHEKPYLIMGWSWFVVALTPVIGLVQAGAQSMADRHMYMPLIGVIVTIAWGVPDLVRTRYRRQIVTAMTIAVTVTAIAITRGQLHHWRNSTTVFEHALAVTNDNFVAHNNLGEELLRAGNTQTAKEHFADAVRIQPNYAIARNNLAAVLARENEPTAAALQYKEAIRLAPTDPEIRSNFGLLLYRQGDFDGAIAQFRTAVALQPQSAQAENNLGAALEKNGIVREALEHYQRASELDPNYERARANVKRLQSQGSVANGGSQ